MADDRLDLPDLPLTDEFLAMMLASGAPVLPKPSTSWSTGD